MGYKEKDAELQRDVLNELFKRQTINANKDVGVAYLQTELEDRINPSVTISADDIKSLTGREKLRRNVLSDYETALTVPGIQVRRVGDASLHVSVVPVRIKENDYTSFTRLRKNNQDELSDDPELGEFDY